MKRAWSFLILLFSISAHANTVESVFKADTVLPQSLQIELLSYLETHCADYLTSYGLTEAGFINSGY